MNKKVRLTATEQAATNKDFYNLFRPIAPSIDTIGKVAQVVSALTEAITIWFITQSELSQYSKVVSITVSILAMLLVVAVLELGGRKFLQVATRAIVWKRLKNAWYKALFGIVMVITIGMTVISFRLSTNGINHAFVSNVPIISLLDHSELKADYRTAVKDITSQFEQELTLLKENHEAAVQSTADKYDARIKAAQLKLDNYENRSKKGLQWANSHVEKYRTKIGTLASEKTDNLASLKETHTSKVEKWQSQKRQALEKEKAILANEIAKVESISGQTRQHRSKNAAFWGTLFSSFVGFSVILAFVCIVSVEVYRRGAGIEVSYEEEDQKDSILGLFWKGLTQRIDHFFRSRAERFANVSSSRSISNRSIGFNQSNPYATAKTEYGLSNSDRSNE